MKGNPIRATMLAILAAILVVAAPGAGFAAAASSPATSYSSTGDLIAGWNWVRSPGQSATWTFDTAALAAARRGSVRLNVSALVTNRVNGGSGYSASGVKFLVTCASDGRAVRLTVTLANPFRPIDPADSGGVGYQAYGASTSPLLLTRFAGCPVLTVSTAGPYRSGRHIAFKAESLTLGFSR